MIDAPAFFRAARGAWCATFAAWAVAHLADCDAVAAVQPAVLTGTGALLLALADPARPRVGVDVLDVRGVRVRGVRVRGARVFGAMLAAVFLALAVVLAVPPRVAPGVVPSVVPGVLHGAWFGTLALAAALGVCALAGVVVARCIASDRARRARLACHAISFLGTVCVALPALASSPIPRALADVTHVDEHALARAIDVPVAIPIALALFGTALMVAAARALLRAGGTADPTDPPTELVDHGIYAHLRHPMIVSEIALVAAASIAYGTVGALVYAVMFATVLLGPWRRAEERALTHRYRGRYRAYANTVAALVPRIPKRDRDRDRDRNSFATRS